MKTRNLLILFVLSLMMAACGTTSTVPITGRKQSLMVDDAKILSLSNEEYNKFMQTAKLSNDAKSTAMVERVGKRLASAVETYLRSNGYAEELKNFQWSFKLVQNNSANAFCLPGGKIVVYDGLLKYTQDEPSLAIVLGHEIAHAVAKHSAEQMSKQIKQQYGAQVLGGVLSVAGADANLSTLAQTGYGLGAQFSSLHYSRSHENEADYMGLIFAAMAGYDPSVAITFWQRMASGKTSSQPEFLSTHPSDATRISNIKKRLPDAQKYYKK